MFMVHIIGSARPAMRRLREGADYEEAELIKLYMLGVIGVGLGAGVYLCGSKWWRV